MKYRLSQSIIAAISVELLPYLRLALVLVSSLALINIGMKAIAQSTIPTQSPSNVFLDYAEYFPGRAFDVLETTFSCNTTYTYKLPSNISCYIDPASGIFSRIETTVSNGIIRLTTFTLRDDSLKVGSLILLFDSPQFHAYSRKVFFFWNKFFAIVTTSARGNPAAMRPVWNVTLTDTY